ncbi:MAG: ABC transporter substrate-binding protein [Nitrospirota bacterium]
MASVTGTAVAVTAVLLLGPVTKGPFAEEQTPKIAVLMSHDAPPYAAALNGFREQLARDGVQAQYDVVVLRGDPLESDEAVQRIMHNGTRLVYALGALGAGAVIDAQISVPVVACMLLNRADVKKVPHAAGVGLEIPVETQFQWLRRLLPNAKRIGVLYNPTENRDTVDLAARVARETGLILTARPIETPRDIPAALAHLANEADVVWGLPDHVVLSPETAQSLLLFSLRNRIPFIGLSTSWAKAGALYALDRDYGDLGAQCGELAMAILDGRSPESFLPASPRKVVYAINLQTARQMKISLPDNLVHGAAEVFQ